jgi:hypothetical protein
MLILALVKAMKFLHRFNRKSIIDVETRLGLFSFSPE